MTSFASSIIGIFGEIASAANSAADAIGSVIDAGGNLISSGIDKIGSGLDKLNPFAHGGSFQVGGRGGSDSNVVAFRATRGETVSIENDKQQRHGGGSVQDAILAELKAIRAEQGVLTARAIRQNQIGSLGFATR